METGRKKEHRVLLLSEQLLLKTQHPTSEQRQFLSQVHCQLVWNLYYVDTAIEGSGLYCYNTEGYRKSVVSQASCRMDDSYFLHLLRKRNNNIKLVE